MLQKNKLWRFIFILALDELTRMRGFPFPFPFPFPLTRMEVSWSLLLAAYGDPWRLRRKIAERGFRPASLATFRVLQETRVRVLAARLLESPQEWAAHLELSGLSFCVRVA
jgi:cytochrome P450